MIEIEDITETTETADVLLWWQWLLIAILVFALSCALYKWIRHSRNRQPKINNLKTALEQLAMIEAKSSELEDTELATELSLLTRQFLRSQLNNNSLFQTHQEFVNDHQDLELLTEQSRSNVSQYLDTLANHKYLPDSNLPESKSSLIEQTKQLLETIKITPATT